MDIRKFNIDSVLSDAIKNITEKSGDNQNFVIFDSIGTILWSGDDFNQIIDYESSELTSYNINEFVHDEDISNTKIAFEHINAKNLITNFENRIRSKNGKYLWFSWAIISTPNEKKVVGIYQNITIQKEIEKEFFHQQVKYKNVFENLPMGIAITDSSGHILETNETARQIFEIPAGKKLKRSLNHRRWPVVSPNGSTILPRNFTLLQALKKKESLKGLEFGLQRESDTVWLEVMATPIPIEGYGLAVGFRDISERKNAEDRISYMAYYDELTGLPRKKFFIEKVEVMLDEALRHDNKVGVIALDIDNFKYLNESFGHNFGDLFLKAVADIIKGSIRNFDLVSREGGDEYMIALPDLDNEADAAIVCESIQSALAKPIQIEKYSAFTSVSMGIAIFPQDGTDPESLLKNADNALHQVKKVGKNTYGYFTQSLQILVKERLEIENNLRLAITLRQFELYYQPKFRIVDGSYCGMEALIRWRHPERGMVSPNDFIPIAEETGLIVPIGEWVMEESIHQFSEIKNLVSRDFQVSLNLSTKQFKHESLLSNLEKYMNINQIAARNLEIEITESALMENVTQAIEILDKVRALGISITIDDFGSGYSSLGYLKKLPVQTVKIDKSFIQDLETNEDSKAIVRAVTSLGHNLGLKVVAEGAETSEQCSLLSDMDVDIIQGFYYAKPMPFDEVMKFLKSHKSD
ncbi:sensor domain-containing protein [Leptospira sp. GIMC2001]|uniref:sensor domain-containing protein n=1 Tax=Leptospira sp. GIMC2001 TaxID=1513297 RepID=UPI00234B5FDF|nr:bifunctional diguanylate cyclase/phosphodiesterase [Leptospira sp. GIMC2001]WCL48815.1 EAL domain-containing protein [Leptospira sp. GIMC2001]